MLLEQRFNDLVFLRVACGFDQALAPGGTLIALTRSVARPRDRDELDVRLLDPPLGEQRAPVGPDGWADERIDLLGVLGFPDGRRR